MAGGLATGLAISTFALNLMSGIGQGIGQRRQRKIAGEEAEANIGILESYLARYPEYAELTMGAYEQQGQQQFRELMTNFGTANVMAGATGQVGPGTSAGALGGYAKGQAVTFAGEDLSLEGDEGLYGMGRSVLSGQLEADREAAEAQLGVWEETAIQSATGAGAVNARRLSRIEGRLEQGGLTKGRKRRLKRRAKRLRHK